MKPDVGIKVGVLACAALACLAGCERQPAGEAPPAIRPGMAAVQIEVVARPKSGYQPPSAYDRVDVPGDPFLTVNYDRLENVIVWLEPEGQAAARDMAAAPLRIALAPSDDSPQMPWYVVCAEAPVILRNTGAVADRFYSVSDGNSFDTGDLAANAEATIALHRIARPEPQDVRAIWAQVVEVFSTRQDEPVAGIVVAPTIWAASTRSGRAVTFTNLPPGAFRVVCWHPRLPGDERRVQLTPDNVTRTQISIGVHSLPAAP